MIHSYVDASTFQDDQNINKIVILIPSRVNHDFEDTNDQDTKPLSLSNDILSPEIVRTSTFNGIHDNTEYKDMSPTDGHL